MRLKVNIRKFGYQGFTALVLILVGNITLANYSFLRFTPSGGSYNIVVNHAIIQSRLALVILPVFLLILLGWQYRQSLLRFLLKNWDVLLWIFVLWLGFYATPSLVRGAQYTVWMSAYLLSILLYLGILAVGKEDQKFKRVLVLLAKAHIILIPLVLYGLAKFGGGSSRLTVGFGDHSFFSNPLMALSLTLLGYFILERRSLSFLQRNMLLVGWLVFTIILFFTGRRTPLVVSLIAGLFLSIQYFERNWILKYLYVVILIVSTVYLAAILPSLIREYASYSDTLTRFSRIKIQSGGEIEESSFAERLLIWESYLQVFEQNKIVGGGFGNAMVNNAKYGLKLDANFSPHNLFIGVLVDTGIVGLALFIIVMLRSIMLMLRKAKPRIRYVYFVILFSIIILNLFEFNLYPGQSLFLYTFMFILYPRCLIT